MDKCLYALVKGEEGRQGGVLVSLMCRRGLQVDRLTHIVGNTVLSSRK